jgi:hypothetical protein
VGVFSVCPWIHLLLTQLLLLLRTSLNSKGDFRVVGDIPWCPIPSGIIDHECGWPYIGPPELFVSGGGAPGTTSAGGVGIGCVRDVDAMGVGVANIMSTGDTSDANVRWERHYPSTECARLGGARC